MKELSALEIHKITHEKVIANAQASGEMVIVSEQAETYHLDSRAYHSEALFLEECNRINQGAHHPDINFTMIANNNVLDWEDFVEDNYELVGIKEDVGATSETS